MRVNFGCAALLAAALCGCERASENVIEGDFQLTGDVNGPLPILLQRDGECAVNLKSGSLAFEDTTYTSKFNVVRACPRLPDSVMPDIGSANAGYTLLGDTLTFRNNTGGMTGMGFRRHPDTLIITGPQHTLIYVRSK